MCTREFLRSKTSTTGRFIISLTLAAALVGCNVVSGSGRLEARSFALADFDAIEVNDAFELELTHAEPFDVQLTLDDNLWKHVTVDVTGHTLRIDLDASRSYTDVTLRAAVALPRLSRLALSGAAHARWQGTAPAVDFLELSAEGASAVSGAVDATELLVALSGASRTQLSGAAISTRISGSGASKVDLSTLSSEHARVSLSGASTASVIVNASLGYALSGASTLTYVGDPMLEDTEVSGGSSVSSVAR